MRELIRTNDAVLVSAVVALLDGAGIQSLVLDQNMSVLEGSLGILPRRVLVAEDHALLVRPHLSVLLEPAMPDLLLELLSEEIPARMTTWPTRRAKTRSRASRRA